MMIELPPITDDDRALLHYNPNTDDIVEWVRAYARQAVAAAMERAAQIAESDEFYGTVTPVAIAAAIRAEMSKEPQ